MWMMVLHVILTWQTVDYCDVVAAETAVRRLIVERNGSNFSIHWSLHTHIANVSSAVLVWCSSRSAPRGCEVIITYCATYVVR